MSYAPLPYVCGRCKTANSTNRPDTYCHDCRREVSQRFSKYTDDSPYERAVRKVERFTGKHREDWEWKVGHAYCRVTDKLAKYLAHQAKMQDGTPAA